MNHHKETQKKSEPQMGFEPFYFLVHKLTMKWC